MTAGRRTDRILLVDDSPDTLEVLERNLSERGFTVSVAPGAPEAIEMLRRSPVDLLITDVKMPGMNGVELLRHVRENFPETQVMLITGYATIDGAVEAVKTGAEEYLSKPFTTQELFAAVGRVLEKRRVDRAQRAGKPQLIWGLVGASEAMRQAFGDMQRAVASDTPVLLLGEGGTGRESVARALHGAGPRTGKPFLALNGEAIPTDQLGSEVDRGLTLAGEGSLYLRAVECWPHEVLERIAGSAGEAALPCRIMASAGPQFSSLITRGVMPETLKPFLDWETIRLPPLRERGTDILLLAEHFARTTAHSCGRRAPELTSPLRQALLFYPWPGNVGELRGAISAAVREGASDPLDLPDLPAAIRSWSASRTPATRPLAEVEAEYIREVLSRMDGNKSRAAEILGIDRKTLREKLK
jgi:DNA-binding NtrC family response regulator